MSCFVSSSPDETIALGNRLAQHVQNIQVIAFTGGMGSGKTTFCRGLAQGLGCIDAVQSPTFAIANVYRGPRLFAHFDAWRIEDERDLEAAGFYDYIEDGALVAMEWSEKVAHLLPHPLVAVDIAQEADGSRKITIEGADGL